MIVIDASIAIKMVEPTEKESDIAKSILLSHLEKKQQIIVPKFLFIEVANALATKIKLTKKSIKESLQFLYNSDFLLYELTEPDLIKASMLAKSYKTSVYDMIYAVIAKNKKVKLITADDRFVKKVGFSFVQTLAHYA